ncbi:MAG TPA: M10 family metallopeptidase C-terminal domain-containing protein [Bauldia sp.]|nr:M10 family metallopeptidase C-terminal domain-containing protein [Bauldia sp.]
MFGGTDNDTLNGGADDDRLTGGTGKDSLTGGTGRDTFDFNAIAETGKGAKRDVILDFKRGQDRIDLDTIDANTKANGNQDFKFIGASRFHKKPGELHILKQGKTLIVEGDVNGDGKADFQIQLNKLSVLKLADFDL